MNLINLFTGSSQAPVVQPNSTALSLPSEDHNNLNERPLGQARKDQAIISDDAKNLLQKEQIQKSEGQGEGPRESSAGLNEELSQADLQTVESLKQRDYEVRQHEQAHKASAGRFASGAVAFSYQQGPDGQRYAIGGHVNIDAGKESDPQQTIRKMDTVRRAALAPANPSSQDRSVAAAASQTKNQATLELRQESIKEVEAEEKTDDKTNEMESEIDKGINTKNADSIARDQQTEAEAKQSAQSINLIA